VKCRQKYLGLKRANGIGPAKHVHSPDRLICAVELV